VDPAFLLDFVLHVDDHLVQMTAAYGPWIYAILFAIVFCETGLVVTPFLPGDSLLFATGALCAASGGGLSLAVAIPVIFIAAVLGDAVNYRIGVAFGPGLLERRLAGAAPPPGLLGKLVKREHLERTQRFYDKYGGKTIILARFVPIVRTFAPFVAGIGRMEYRRFFTYNVVGGLVWVLVCVLAGFFFGALPWVQRNFETVVLAIIVVSVLPIVIEAARGYLAARRARQAAPEKPAV
jgi:membrane-associated protein